MVISSVCILSSRVFIAFDYIAGDEFKGAIVKVFQAYDFAKLLGLIIKKLVK